MKYSKIFLDSNFIIASQIKEHKFYERTQKLRSEWEINGTQLYMSPLVLDEVLYVARSLLAISKEKKEEIYRQLRQMIENIFKFKHLILLQTHLIKDDWLEILKIMEACNNRPRDSIILRTMQKEGINVIASFDSDFNCLALKQS